MSKIFTIFLMALIVGGGCSVNKYYPHDDWVYLEDWDGNGDLKLDSAEFIGGYTRDKLFEQDRAIGKALGNTAEESAKAIFSASDKNQDGVISGLEFYKWEIYRGDSTRANENLP